MSKDHNEAETAYGNYMTLSLVACQLSEDISKQVSHREIMIAKNRGILEWLFDITRLIGKLGLPFRGHREDIESQNKGLYCSCWRHSTK